jgi:hypothetical protein
MKAFFLDFLKSIKMAAPAGKAVEAWIVWGFAVVTTASFTYMEFVTSSEGQFPFFHLGCLLVGGLVIVSLKRRYDKIYISEAVGAFALFAIFLSLFTSPVAEALRNLIR